MLIEVDGRTYGWGADVRDLPENSDAYGPHIMDLKEQTALGKAIVAAGWVPQWKLKPHARVVFLCDPKAKWRQSLTTRDMVGQTLQVTEKS